MIKSKLNFVHEKSGIYLVIWTSKEENRNEPTEMHEVFPMLIHLRLKEEFLTHERCGSVLVRSRN